MFGNKKTSAPTDDNIQLTTRSMKNDLEGSSPEEDLFIDNKSNISLENKKEQLKETDLEKEVDLRKKDSFIKVDKKPLTETKKAFVVPNNLPVSSKMPASDKKNEVFSSLNNNQQNIEKQKTHADDFFPKSKSNFEKTLENKNPQENLRDLNRAPSPVTPQKPLSTSVPKKNYDEFFKDKIKKPLPEENNSSLSLVIIIIMIVIIIATIGAGAYYYFFIINSSTPPPTVEPVDPIFPIEDIDPVQPPIEESLPTALTEAKTLKITKENIKTVIFNSKNPENIFSGFYIIENNAEEGAIINTENISDIFDINLPITLTDSSLKTWIFYDNSSQKPEINLVIDISEKELDEIKNSLMEKEKDLPAMLSGIYATPAEKYLVKEAIFTESIDNPGFRYYNFKKDLTSTESLDWGIIADNKLLVFATSKTSALKIAELLNSTDSN